MPDSPGRLDPNPDTARTPDSRLSEEMPRRGPAGDARPNAQDPDPRTRGGQPQEGVENRPSAATVEPEDYPEEDRADGRADGV